MLSLCPVRFNTPHSHTSGGLLVTKTERRSGRHMLGWDSLLSIYKRVPDSATGEMILVRRPELGGLESQFGSAAPSICGGGASAVVSAVSQFGGAPVRAAAAPTCPGGGGGPMPTFTCGAVTNATTSFHFSPAPAASPVGAATLAAGGFFGPRPATPPRQLGTGQPQFQIERELDPRQRLAEWSYHSITKMSAYQVRSSARQPPTQPPT
jgi:hypothetical protein